MRFFRRFPFTTLAVLVEASFALGALWAGESPVAMALVLPGYALHTGLAVTILPGGFFWLYAAVVVATGVALDALRRWATRSVAA